MQYYRNKYYKTLISAAKTLYKRGVLAGDREKIRVYLQALFKGLHKVDWDDIETVRGAIAGLEADSIREKGIGH